MIMPPTPLRNGSSGYATGHPVMHPDRGWASVRNMYKLLDKYYVRHLAAYCETYQQENIPVLKLAELCHLKE